MAGPYLICWVKDLDPVSFLGLVQDTTGSVCLASLDRSQGISGSASGLSLGSKVITSDAEEMCPCAFGGSFCLQVSVVSYCLTLGAELVPGAAAGGLLFHFKQQLHVSRNT